MSSESESPVMSPRMRMQLRAAALGAVESYPGPVGELLARELWAWEEFGYRLGAGGLMDRLVTHLLDLTSERG